MGVRHQDVAPTRAPIATDSEAPDRGFPVAGISPILVTTPCARAARSSGDSPCPGGEKLKFFILLRDTLSSDRFCFRHSAVVLLESRSVSAPLNRRAGIVLVLAILALGIFAGGLAVLLQEPRSPIGAPRPQRLYYAFCASCHGLDGGGSWRAALFLIRPGNLADGHLRDAPEPYLFDIIKNGGAPIGRPGMPGFGFSLSDEDIRALVSYLRALPQTR